MKVALIYNKKTIEPTDVINIYGMKTKEYYSQKAVDRVAAALEKGGHTVKLIEGNMHAIEEMQGFMPKVVAGERPGMVFNMAYGIQGHNRYTHVPAMLEMLGVPYIGSGPEVHAIVQDKVMTKIVLQRSNIPTPGFWVFSTPDEHFDDLVFPVIVKPKMESTSMGMKVVDNWKDLRDAVKEEIDKYQQDALVEQFIPGREFAVGLLGNRNNLEVLPIVEIDLEGDPNKIQTKGKKLKGEIPKICPAKLDPVDEKEMKNLCVNAFNKLELNDFCRVDIRMDSEGRMYILELNSMASLGLQGSYVTAALKAGYTYEALINKILDVAAIRNFGESILEAAKAGMTENVRSQPLRIAARSYLRSHLRTTVLFLKQICEINTTVRNVENVNKLTSIVTKRLRHLDFTEHVYQQFDVGDIKYFANHEDLKNDILLICHLDVPYPSRDFTRFREERGKISGTGITESKGGLAILLSALQSLRFTRRLRKIKCGILLTTDYTLGGDYSKSLIEEYSKHSGCVVSLKWCDLDGGVITSCYGRDEFNVELSNTKDSINPTISDLIPAVSKKIIALNKLSKKDSIVKVTSMEARTSYGQAPDYASFSVINNFQSNTIANDLEKQLRQILKKQDSMKLDIEISKGFRREALVESKVSLEFLESIKKIADSIDVKIHGTNRLISSDISYVADGIPAIDGLGPLGGSYRSPNEYILRDSLIDRALLLALIISNSATLDKK